MDNLACPPTADRLYGLSLIWQEANYNFAFFDRVTDLDWEACYRDYISRVISADDLMVYYDLLARFIALLKDGHTLVIPPKSVYLSLDRPKLTLMNIDGVPIVTNVSDTIGNRVPIGSKLLEIDGTEAEEYLSTRVIPLVCETTPHRLRDQAVSRILLGRLDSHVRCKFSKPDGGTVDMDLLRNRRADPGPWLCPSGAPDRSEFKHFDDWFYNEATIPAFEFRMLEGVVGYVALNSFMDPTVATSFEETLPTLRGCSSLILDLRKNHGGNDDFGYSIVSHFLRQATETCLVRTQENVALYRARGVNLKDTPADRIPDLPEASRKHLLCYQKQWYHEESWGQIQPAQEVLSLPTVILTGSETGSASEDFIMAFYSGKGEAIRIGMSTAGSTGQPLIEGLPGGGMLAICTVRMPWPEEVWRKGIEPHIWVEPTVEDVIRDEDRTLNVALSYLNGQILEGRNN